MIQREADGPNQISGGNCNNITPVESKVVANEVLLPNAEIVKCPWCGQMLPKEHYCIDYL